MATAGTAYVSIRGDFGPLNTGLRRSQGAFGRSLGQMETRAQRTFRRIGAFAKIGAVAGIAGIGVAARKAFGEFEESERANRQTQAVLKSTGNVAGVTADEIEKLANAISLKSGKDDEAIQSAENLLLTFTSVRNEVGKGNDIFSQATSIIADMSAALGQDFKSSTIQVGKALQDPIKGITALRRVGVNFNAQQTEQVKKMVESGHQLQAQKFILRELKKEFEGSAAAQATSADKLRVAINNLLEAFGKTFGPVLEKAFQGLANFVNQMNEGTGVGGKFATVVKGVGNGIRAAFSGISSLASGAVDAIDELIGRFGDLRTEGKSVPATLGTILGEAISSIDLGAIADKIGAGIEQGLDFGDKFAAAVTEGIQTAFSEIDGEKLLGGLLEVVVQAINALFSPRFWIEHFGAILSLVTIVIPVGKIFKIPGFGILFNLISKPFFRAVQAVGRGLVRLFGKAGSQMVTGFLAELEKTFPRVAGVLLKLTTLTGKELRKLPGLVTAPIRRFASTLAKGFENAASRAGSALAKGLTTFIGPVARAVGRVVGGATRPLRDAVGTFASAGRRWGNALKNSFLGIIRGIAGALKRSINAIIGVIEKGINAATPGKIKIPLAPDIPGVPDIKLPRLAKGGQLREAALALVGEEGPELIKSPTGQMGLVGAYGPEIQPLPTGTRVYSHPETKRKLKPLTQNIVQRLVPAEIGQPKSLTQQIVQETLGTKGGRQSQGGVRSRGLKSLLEALRIPGFAKGGIVRQLDPWAWDEEEDEWELEEPRRRRPGTGAPLGFRGLRTPRRKKKREPRAVRRPLSKPGYSKPVFTEQRERQIKRSRAQSRVKDRRERRARQVGRNILDITAPVARKQARRFERTRPKKKGGFLDSLKDLKPGRVIPKALKFIRPGGPISDFLYGEKQKPGLKGALLKRAELLQLATAFPATRAGDALALKKLAEFRAAGISPPAALVRKERAIKRRAEALHGKDYFAESAPLIPTKRVGGSRITWEKGETGRGLFDLRTGQMHIWPEEQAWHAQYLARHGIREHAGFGVSPTGLVTDYGQFTEVQRQALRAAGLKVRRIPRHKPKTGGPQHFGKGKVKGSTAFTPAVRYLISTMKEKFGLRLSSGIRPDAGFHSEGKAADFVGPKMREAAEYVRESGLYKTLLEGVHNPVLSAEAGKLVSPSSWGAKTWAEHKDHIHLAADDATVQALPTLAAIAGEHRPGIGAPKRQDRDPTAKRGQDPAPARRGAQASKKEPRAKIAASGGGLAMVARANKLDSLKLPYRWGGGHGDVGQALQSGFDCSGAVSYVLGIPSKVSSELTRWGEPGKGPVTVYANARHTMMSLFGRGFGTSGKQGPRWLPFDSLPNMSIRHAPGVHTPDTEGGGKAKAKPRRITGGHLSVGQMVTLAKRVGFPDPALAAAIGYAESRGQVAAVGDSGDSLGLWQINTPAHPNYDHERLLHDAAYNARAALAISKQGKNFQPWTQYRTGAYKKFAGRKGMPLPRGTTKNASGQGSSLADFIAMKLIPNETGLLPSDSLRYITRGLRYWRGVRRRNIKAGNFQRAGDAKSQINDLLAARKTFKEQQKDPEADLGDIQPFDVIGSGPNAFRIGGLQRVIDGIQLRIAEAGLTVPPDTDDTQAAIKASLQDDIAAQGDLTKVWEGIYTLTKGIRLPGRPLPGGVFNPTKAQSKALATAGRRGGNAARIALLNKFITDATQGPFIVGTLKQQTDAATNLATARTELKSLTDEAGRKEEVDDTLTAQGPTAKQAGAAFFLAISELFKQYGSNIRALQKLAKGGIARGIALVGEQGPELIELPRQFAKVNVPAPDISVNQKPLGVVGLQGPEIVNLPVGTRVRSHPESKRIADKLGIQGFAKGGIIGNTDAFKIPAFAGGGIVGPTRVEEGTVRLDPKQIELIIKQAQGKEVHVQAPVTFREQPKDAHQFSRTLEFELRSAI